MGSSDKSIAGMWDEIRSCGCVEGMLGRHSESCLPVNSERELSTRTRSNWQ